MKLASVLLSLLLVPFAVQAQDGSSIATSPRVRVTTSAGTFVIELDSVRAPLTVAAFLKYVDNGHYEGTIFHRVVQGFIAQGGGYTTDLKLKPVEGNVPNESGNGLSNLRGTVGLARSSEPHSGNCQFYINLADNIDLDPRPTRWGYAVFGKIVDGMDVVDDIGHRPTGGGGPFNRNVPVEPIVIEHIERLLQ